MSSKAPLFSVVMPTRDRPELFARALSSVLSQRFDDVEVVVVNDGSEDRHLPAYEAIIGKHPSLIRLVTLPRRPQGHGPSFAVNSGARQSTGRYLCFLDDDDYWSDTGHLERAASSVRLASASIDLYMANQTAVAGDGSAPRLLWVAGLSNVMERKRCSAEACGAFSVTVDDLLACGGFCHMNTLIVRRELFEAIGGMDEGIRWEGDRDLFLRLIDIAKVMHYAPTVVSTHNIPDAGKAANETTRNTELQKRLSQLKVLDKAALLAAHPGIRGHARQHRNWTLKKIAEELDKSGELTSAAYYARAALGNGPTPGWTAYTMWLSVRALFGT